MTKKSLKILETCHPDLQALVKELIKELDLVVLVGHRDQMEQHQAFINGASKLQWPRSKHNKVPSEAVDIRPLGKPSTADYLEMCRRVEEIAKRLGIKIKLGRDFGFKQYEHLELHDKHKK